ncbi:MAG: hypothetical protein ACI87E_005184, partial [Mariniblastus sp.]
MEAPFNLAARVSSNQAGRQNLGRCVGAVSGFQSLMRLFVCSVVACLSMVAAADETVDDPSEILFARRIAPLLQEKCVACHGAALNEIEGGLDLRSFESSTTGGDSGEPGLVAGKPGISSIYRAAARDEETFSAMPPKASEKLSEQQLAWLHDWIESGASWPSKQRQAAILKQYSEAWASEDGLPIKTSGGLSPDWTNRKYDPAGLWAYQPVNNVANVLDARQSKRHAIDELIENALPDGMQVAPLASRRELIRRATFDLIGLPPTPTEVTAFVNDDRSDDQAFAAVIERLLASPHYGEKMAAHWLDVARYADSSGFANDYERGNAWRYRDYVVRSFNNDKPYDRFVKEQIAGDEIMPGDPEGVIATGFLRMGPWELTVMEVERVARQRFLDDVTNSVGEAFLGHSLQCARCHDHKFDPVPTRDYYSIQAVFATTQLAERPAKFLDSENTAGFEEKRFLLQRQQAYVETQVQMQAVLEANAKNWFADKLTDLTSVHERALEKQSPEKQDLENQKFEQEKATLHQHKQQWVDAFAKFKLKKPTGAFNAVRNDFVKRGIPQDEFPPQLVGFTTQQFGVNRVAGKGLQRLQWELDRYEPYAHSVYSGHTPTLTRVHAPLRMPKNVQQGELEASCIRSNGDPFAKGEPVAPGTLSVIGDLVPSEISADLAGRRAKFAEWVAHPKNPLTTRVIVNRVWQWHFGKAIAGNPNNFGSTGQRPTHPQVLDYLASSLVKNGWSIKNLHRQIMLSKTYRRSSQYSQDPQASEAQQPASPSNHSYDSAVSQYAVFEPRRLTAEELRDAMLAVTGELSPAIGGIPCRPEINVEVAMQPRQVMGTFASAWVPNPKPQQRHRRSIYIVKLRGVLPPMLDVFNSPSPDFSCERRESSTV